MSANKETPYPRKTLMNYVITAHQDAIINYLVPSVASSLLYIFLFASDVAVVFRHYKDDNPVWASLTLFLIYLPSLSAYIVIVSSWELWPDLEGCERDNCVWFIVKTLEHLLFPVWAMWRYAERLFWSIEAVRSTDDKLVASATEVISSPRTIELYFFFQAFLHSLPQMLLQLNILMRQDYHVNKQTADAQVLSFVFSLTKLAATVAFYQRFKTQKLAGKQYPWYKSYKRYGFSIDMLDSRVKSEKRPISATEEPDMLDSRVKSEKRPINATEEPDMLDSRTKSEKRPISAIEEPVPSESRRSSDFYLEPELREAPIPMRETSVLDGPMRQVYQDLSEPDFNIRRVEKIQGLPEDDLAGKLVSFFWWSCFLLARILAIAAFFYFYPTATFWLLLGHFFIVISFLIYDAKSDEVKRAKAVFFVFIGLLYIFCIIEFKIKFKKTKFMYCGYFALVFVQNFVMCMIWWFKNVEELENTFWFRYIFYIVIMGSIISVSSMMLYLNVYKPKKVVVGERVLERTSY